MEKFAHDSLWPILRAASASLPTRQFTCHVFSEHWNQFVELWAPRIYSFLRDALGPFPKEPRSEILPLTDGFHSAGANASFNPTTGQICLGKHMENDPGVTIEKLLHELLHNSLQNMDEGDEFYEEGVCDYGVWLLAHAPVWGEHRDAVIAAAEKNIHIRRDRAMRTGSDYDRKRWAGGIFMMTCYGPHLIASLRQKKLEGNTRW